MYLIHERRNAFFNEHAETWEDSESFPENAAQVEGIIHSLESIPDGNILDVGTGTGIALKSLQEITGSDDLVVGIDLAENMLDQAGDKGASLVRCDAHRLPFASATFGTVFAFAVVPHLDTPKQFFIEASRILCPDGLLVVLHLMSREECNDFHRKAGTAVEHDVLPAPGELDRFARLVGFRREQFEEREGLFLWTARRHSTE